MSVYRNLLPNTLLTMYALSGDLSCTVCFAVETGPAQPPRCLLVFSPQRHLAAPSVVTLIVCSDKACSSPLSYHNMLVDNSHLLTTASWPQQHSTDSNLITTAISICRQQPSVYRHLLTTAISSQKRSGHKIWSQQRSVDNYLRLTAISQHCSAKPKGSICLLVK